MAFDTAISGSAGIYVYRSTARDDRPQEHYTPRVIPRHDGAFKPLGLPLIFWQMAEVSRFKATTVCRGGAPAGPLQGRGLEQQGLLGADIPNPDNIRTVYIERDNIVRVHHLVANPHKEFRFHYEPV